MFVYIYFSSSRKISHIYRTKQKLNLQEDNLKLFKTHLLKITSYLALKITFFDCESNFRLKQEKKKKIDFLIRYST